MKDLTELDLNILETGVRLGLPEALKREQLLECISMARRTLEVEERLERAIAALIRIENDNMECGHCSRGGLTPDELATEVLMEIAVDRPKAIHPPQECAPPEGTDVPPSQGEACKHGTPFRYSCEECDAEDLGYQQDPDLDPIRNELKKLDEEFDSNLEAMRKGLDDHSCNSTGWEKS